MRYCAFLLLLLAAHCLAQIPCSSAASSIEAAAALTAQNELRRVHVDDMEEGVSRQIATQMAQFKDRLTRATDVALTCAGQSISPADLQDALARSLHANLPEPRTDQSISRNDPNYAEITGSWGHDLQVRITRPAVPADLLEVRYSVNIECGDDTLLLAYEWQADRWRLRLRWQAPELHTILDAHGDFFLTAYLANPAAEPRVTASGSPAPKTAATWLVAVAHGRPWCTSRFSGFLIDLLAPGPDPASPQIVWQAM
jgi:hypothetical protein